MKKTIQVVLVAVLGLFIAGCATVQQSVVKSKASYETVFRACIDALPEIQFSASSADQASGLIVAEQPVFGGGGKVSRMNIMLTKSSDGVSVSVKFIPPPGTVTIGDGGFVNRYIGVLRDRIPDIVVSGAK